MEVHHHSHTARKKWSHYFWEFLMLFLAVFCGFLAENKREHIVEHQREKQYIRSMVQDLRTDVSNIQVLLTHFDEKVLRYDTLDHFLTEFLKGSSLPFERNFSAFTYYPDYSPVDRTISQLKNSGALRLIRNEQVSDSIIAYDARVTDLMLEQDILSTRFHGFNNFLDQILDRKKFLKSLEENAHPASQARTDYFLPHTAKEEGILSNMLFKLSNFIGVWTSKLHDHSLYASRLIDFLRTEYHL